MNNVIESYLVSLGFSVSDQEFRKFHNAMEDAARSVADNTTGIAKRLLETQGAIVTTFTGIAAAIGGVVSKTAMADQEFRLMGLRTMQTATQVRELDVITKILGADLASIVWDPELNQRAQKMADIFQELQKQEGPDVAKNLKGWRDIFAEFGRFEKMDLPALARQFSSDLFKALNPNGNDLDSWLDKKLKAFEDEIPDLAQKLTDYAVPALTETWHVFLKLGEVVKEGSIAFTNIIGLLSGDQSIVGSEANWDKFAGAIGHVATAFEKFLDLIIKSESTLAHFAAGMSLELSGKWDAASKEFKAGIAEWDRSNEDLNRVQQQQQGTRGETWDRMLGLQAMQGEVPKDDGAIAKAIAKAQESYTTGQTPEEKEEQAGGDLLKHVAEGYLAMKAAPYALRGAWWAAKGLGGLGLGALGFGGAEAGGAAAGAAAGGAGAGIAGGAFGAGAGLLGIDALLGAYVGKKYYEYFSDPAVDHPVQRFFGVGPQEEIPDITKMQKDRAAALQKHGASGYAGLLGISIVPDQAAPSIVDKSIIDLAKAMAGVEGYGKEGNISTRANNPGDIMQGSFAKREGATGEIMSKGGPVAMFPDVMTGFKAMIDLLESKIQKGASLFELIAGNKMKGIFGWSPADAPGNTPESTQAYVDKLAKSLGIDPNVPLSTILRPGYDSQDLAPHLQLQSWTPPQAREWQPQASMISQPMGASVGGATTVQQNVTISIPGIYITQPGANEQQIHRAVSEAIKERLDERVQGDLAQISPQWN